MRFGLAISQEPAYFEALASRFIPQLEFSTLPGNKSGIAKRIVSFRACTKMHIRQQVLPPVQALSQVSMEMPIRVK